MTKIAKIWPGNNCLSFGKCISGPKDQWFGSLCFYLSALICVVAVSTLVTPLVWVEVSPILPIAFYICVTLTAVFLNLTACTDPGIIPRRPFIQKMKESLKDSLPQEKQLKDYYSTFLEMKVPQQDTKPETLIEFHQRQSHRYCHTCHIYRPPRASHCGICDNCVLVFDHHCGFINNCIGMRNYRYFVLFLVGACLSFVLFVINLVVYGIVKAGTEVSTIVIIVIGAVGVVCIVGPLIGFLGYHCFLIVTGKTTRQSIKKLDNTHGQNSTQKVYQNLWCSTEDAMIDVFQQLPQTQINQIGSRLKELQKQTKQRKKMLLEEYQNYQKEQLKHKSETSQTTIKVTTDSSTASR